MAPRPSPVAVAPTPGTIPLTVPGVTATPTPESVTFLDAPLYVERGHTATATLHAQTAPDSDCSIDVGYPSPPELDEATSDGSGIVSWSWRVGRRMEPGSWPITVSCRTGTGTTQITVR
jgi:hypothetical protein